MEKFRKSISLFMSLLCVLNFCIIPAHAVAPEDLSSEVIAENTSEIVEIENVYYKYEYYNENGLRTTKITNLSSGSVDVLAYNPTTSIMYLNGEIFAEGIISTDSFHLVSPASAGWQVIGSSSHRVTWLQATSLAVVAGAIAIYLGNISSAKVIAIMGANTLSILAANCSGGTLYVTTQMLEVALSTPKYRHIWSFTANTGDSYGPYTSPVF